MAKETRFFFGAPGPLGVEDLDKLDERFVGPLEDAFLFTPAVGVTTGWGDEGVCFIRFRDGNNLVNKVCIGPAARFISSTSSSSTSPPPAPTRLPPG